MVFCFLGPSEVFLPDIMATINFSQSASLQMGRRKLSKKLSASVLKSHGSLLLERRGTNEPLDFMWFQKSISPVLSIVLILDMFELLNQRLVLQRYLLEPRHVLVSNMREGALVYLGKVCVADV